MHPPGKLAHTIARHLRFPLPRPAPPVEMPLRPPCDSPIPTPVRRPAADLAGSARSTQCDPESPPPPASCPVSLDRAAPLHRSRPPVSYSILPAIVQNEISAATWDSRAV